MRPLSGDSTTQTLSGYPTGRKTQIDGVTQTCTGHSDGDIGHGQMVSHRHAQSPRWCHETQICGIIQTTWSWSPRV